MKAFLLAAGVGSRLQPLTNTVPKCMVPIAGRPLLDIWLDAFRQIGVTEVLVNLHYLSEQVSRHLEQRRAAAPTVHAVYEPELLGSAGTLVANRKWVEGEELFLACNADNLTNFDLRRLVDAHRKADVIASLAVFHSPRPWTGGVAELDGTGRLVGFIEKPTNPKSDLINAGIYVFCPALIDEIDGSPPKDIGYDLLPRVVGRAQAVPIDGYFRDIGTLEDYERAQSEWKMSNRQ